MNQSESIAKLSESLAKFQAEVKNPANTAVNPYYKSRYSPLSEVFNTVRPILGKYGLSVFQNQATNEAGQLGVSTKLMHSSGEFIETDFIYASPEKNTPQGLGSVSTYLRRYQLSSALGISSEDDDDGNSSEPEKATKKLDSKQPESKTPKKDTNEDESEDKIKKAIGNIEDLAGKLSAKNVDKTLIANAIKKHNIIGEGDKAKGVANYNKITSIDVAREVYKSLKELEA